MTWTSTQVSTKWVLFMAETTIWESTIIFKFRQTKTSSILQIQTVWFPAGDKPKLQTAKIAPQLWTCKPSTTCKLWIICTCTTKWLSRVKWPNGPRSSTQSRMMRVKLNPKDWTYKLISNLYQSTPLRSRFTIKLLETRKIWYKQSKLVPIIKPTWTK